MKHHETLNNATQATNNEIQAAITIFQNQHEFEGKRVEQISVRCHRNTYIVTAIVNDKRTSKSVPKSIARITAQIPQVDEDVQQEFATCVGCNSIGPLGNFCTASSCLDSGNIYADDPFVSDEN